MQSSSLVELRILDLGSNSFQLQHVRVSEAGLETLTRRRAFFRLGSRLNADGLFSDETIELADGCVTQLLEGVAPDTPIWGIATAAARRAGNGGRLVSVISERRRVPISILSGEREAEFAFLGAWTALPDDFRGRIAVVDIGGGSTEIAVGTRSHIAQQMSLAVGALDLPSRDAGEATWEQVDRAVSDAPLAVTGQLQTVVFASGSARAVRDVGAALRHLAPEDPARDWMSARELESVACRALQLEDEDLVAAGCPPERVGVVAQTACLMSRVVEFCGATGCRIVGTGVREGVAIRLYELARASAQLTDTPWNGSMLRSGRSASEWVGMSMVGT